MQSSASGGQAVIAFGAGVGAIFSAVWFAIAVSMSDGAWRMPAGIGVAVAIALAIAALRRSRALPGDRLALMRSRPYRLVVGAEVALIAAGSALLSQHGHVLVVTWIALIVGVHFIALAVFAHAPRFHPVGIALIAIAGLGLVLRLSGHDTASHAAIVAACSGCALAVSALVNLKGQATLRS